MSDATTWCHVKGRAPQTHDLRELRQSDATISQYGVAFYCTKCAAVTTRKNWREVLRDTPTDA